ncbi:MAG: hypothetical protein ACOH2F_20350 [Cellulomonas sp.]
MAVVGALLLLCTSACAAGKNIEVTNGADASVTVLLGEDDLGEVTSGGGVAVLDTTDCQKGPIVVTYEDGRVITLKGPICPGETLAVSDTEAIIVPAADSK